MPRFTRTLTPAGFVLAGLCFLLPFATVSCDAPGGFGRAAPGGTTTYTGVDLVIGGAPSVDKPAPAAQQRNDRLGVQPLAVGVVILIVGAGVATALVRHARVRRITAIATATGAAIALVANQVTTEALLASRLSEQLTEPLPAGKRAADFVHTAEGFGACLLVLLVVILGNAITAAWRSWQARRERRAFAAGSPEAGLPIPVDPWAGSADSGYPSS
ncbi:MAG TPA: hypothetical protein VGJ63_06580 [Micromonosporaceae bacterium]|jgi:hypothetical protein